MTIALHSEIVPEFSWAFAVIWNDEHDSSFSWEIIGSSSSDDGLFLLEKLPLRLENNHENSSMEGLKKVLSDLFPYDGFEEVLKRMTTYG